MKQIDEVPLISTNRLFETPQKRDRPLKKCSQGKAFEVPPASLNQKFDLEQSPKFKGSTDIQDIHVNPNQSSAKQQISHSVKMQYNSPPILVKVQHSPYMSNNKFISSKKKKDKIRVSYKDIRSNDNFDKCYANFIKKIKQGVKFEFPGPEIIVSENEEENVYSQLLTFSLNFKNSRKLIYNEKKHTLVSVYECLGCRTEFDNSPALGGHVRSCHYKFDHYQKLEMYHKADCMLVENSSESIEQNYPKKEQSRENSLFKTPSKNPEMDSQQNCNITEKQKEIQSIFCSSEEKSVSKSFQGYENQFDRNEEEFVNEESEKDEGCLEDSEEYNPNQERTAKKLKKTSKRTKEIKGKFKTKQIQKN